MSESIKFTEKNISPNCAARTAVVAINSFLGLVFFDVVLNLLNYLNRVHL